MSDDNNDLKILSNEELDAKLHSEDTASEAQEEKSYEGPERRIGMERREGSRDRREMLRFEPEKDRADRREGKDRRSANNKAEDLWKQRDI